MAYHIDGWMIEIEEDLTDKEDALLSCRSTSVPEPGSWKARNQICRKAQPGRRWQLRIWRNRRYIIADDTVEGQLSLTTCQSGVSITEDPTSPTCHSPSTHQIPVGASMSEDASQPRPWTLPPKLEARSVLPDRAFDDRTVHDLTEHRPYGRGYSANSAWQRDGSRADGNVHMPA